MKKISSILFLTSLLVLLSVVLVKAQHYEVGIMGGVATYKGELKDHLLTDKHYGPSTGVFFRFNFSRRYSFKFGGYYGEISGDDKDSEFAFNRNRNLDFRTEIVDVGGQFEFNFLPYRVGNPKFPFSPYVLLGLSVFTFNPQGTYTDPNTRTKSFVYLQPLGTEGQGTSSEPSRPFYKLTQIAIPFGGGLKYHIGPIGIGLELCARRTYTDYLDDVSQTYADPVTLSAENGFSSVLMGDKSLDQNSKVRGQRGNPDDRDWFMFTSFWISFRLDRDPTECEPFNLKNWY